MAVRGSDRWWSVTIATDNLWILDKKTKPVFRANRY